MKCWSRKAKHHSVSGRDWRDFSFNANQKQTQLCIPQLVLGEVREGKPSFRSAVPVPPHPRMSRRHLNEAEEIAMGADGSDNPRLHEKHHYK